MIWKKTWFSYVLWALYSVVVSMAYASGLLLYVPLGKSPYLAVGVVCLYFLLTAFAFFFLQQLLQNLGNKKLRKNVAAVLESVLIFAVFCGCFLFQAKAVSGMDPKILAESEYLAKSFVQEGVAVSGSAYGAEWFYLYVLRGLFIFTGNHARAAFWLQFVLQTAGSLFLCGAIRKLSGSIAGALGFTGLMIIPAYVSGLNILTPLWVEFFLFAVGFCGVVFCLRRRKKVRGTGASVFAAAFFLGVYFSCVIYGDLSGILLIFLAVSMLWSRPAANAGQTIILYGSQVKVMQTICLFGGCAAGLFLFFLGGPCSFQEWRNVYGLEFGLNFSGMAALCFVILCGFLFCGIFRFFYEKEEDSLCCMFLFFLGALALGLTGMTMPGMQEMWLLVLLTICAAVSLGRSMTRLRSVEEKTPQAGWKTLEPEEKTAVEERVTDLGQPGGKTPASEEKENLMPEEPIPEEREEPVPEKKEEAIPEETMPKEEEKMATEEREQKMTEGKASEKERKENLSGQEIQEEKPQIKFLENPLPGPKKHVPRTLDFELGDEQLKDRSELEYDVTINDDDDFDL